mgnify:CR=1 FL=1
MFHNFPILHPQDHAEQLFTLLSLDEPSEPAITHNISAASLPSVQHDVALDPENPEVQFGEFHVEELGAFPVIPDDQIPVKDKPVGIC